MCDGSMKRALIGLVFSATALTYYIGQCSTVSVCSEHKSSALLRWPHNVSQVKVLLLSGSKSFDVLFLSNLRE